MPVELEDFGRVYHEEDDTIITVTALAIAQYEGDISFYLFSCDAEWNVISDTLHNSLQEAFGSAELSNNSIIKWNSSRC